MTSDALHHLAARGLSDAGGPKPLLLRVLTDLFVMRATHTSEETRQFAEIARRLIDDATPDECDHAARVLCHHEVAPPDVIDRLATRGGDGALKLYRRMPRAVDLVPAGCRSDGRRDPAIALAQRPDLDATMIAALASRDDIDVLRTLAHNEAAPLSAASAGLCRARAP